MILNSHHTPQQTTSDGSCRTAAKVTIEWGYEDHSITLTPRNWSKVKAGKILKIRGKGFYSEGDFFWDYWSFGGGLDGSLVVNYGEEAGCGFDGNLSDATIEELRVFKNTDGLMLDP